MLKYKKPKFILLFYIKIGMSESFFYNALRKILFLLNYALNQNTSKQIKLFYIKKSMWILLKIKMKLHLQTSHPYHLVAPSPWPIFASSGGFCLTIDGVLHIRKSVRSFSNTRVLLEQNQNNGSKGDSTKKLEDSTVLTEKSNVVKPQASTILSNKRLYSPKFIGENRLLRDNFGNQYLVNPKRLILNTKKNNVNFWYLKYPEDSYIILTDVYNKSIKFIAFKNQLILYKRAKKL